MTTPEKWDSLTRRWKDHKLIVQMVKLFIIDEVNFRKSCTDYIIYILHTIFSDAM